MYEIAIISFGYVICRFNLLMSLFINVSEDEKMKFYGQFKQRCVKVQQGVSETAQQSFFSVKWHFSKGCGGR